MRKDLIAMILVGGKGTRLQAITHDIAKPAVSFGAKYRLIDFTLSNITNSNIDVVGIVTQYEPYELMTYIGSGASWDLDFIDGGIRFLTPYATNDTILWQQGTAHAVKQYYNFITENKAEYVLILPGDHVYKMDYERMFAHHLQQNAEITIAGTKVSQAEASRFGIMTKSSDGLLGQFQEKPKRPKSLLASMGIYLFKADVLRDLLMDGLGNEDVDFGKNVIPKALNQKRRIAIYEFFDYWADVGTIESLYQANMDLLDNPEFLTLNVSRNLPIYSKSLNLPPNVIKENAKLHNAIIADGSIIDGTIVRSTIGYETIVSEASFIENCVILPGVLIGKNVKLKNIIVNRNLKIPDNFVYESEMPALLDDAELRKRGDLNG